VNNKSQAIEFVVEMNVYTNEFILNNLFLFYSGAKRQVKTKLKYVKRYESESINEGDTTGLSIGNGGKDESKQKRKRRKI
jgi:hypothetical protein